MSEWSNYSLGDLAEITSSKRIFYSEYVDSGIPFYRSKEVINLFKREPVQTELFITHERFNEIESKFGVPNENDILLTSVGSLGIPYLVKASDKFYFKDGNLTWFRNIDKSLLDPKYLYIWLSSSIGKQKLDEVTIGSTQAALTISGLKTIEIELPPLPEQKAIASVLSSLDDKIDLLHRQNKTLEAMAETLFRQWFIEEAKEDWEELTLADVCNRITDGSHSSPASVETGYPMASVKDMYDWGINQSTCRKISKEDYDALVQADCKALQGDILIAKDGSYLKHVFLLEESLDVVLLSSIAMLRPNGQYHPMLLTLFLKLDSTHELMQNIVTGAVIPRIVLKDFRKFPIQLPPKELQDKAVEIVTPIFQKCWENNRQIQTLENLRDTLLPKLMGGEVRVQYQTEEVA